MADETRRIDIGFQGGQVLPARVKQAEYDSLRRRLVDDSAKRWHELETQDSMVASTSRRSSTSASTPTTSGSASMRLGCGSGR